MKKNLRASDLNIEATIIFSTMFRFLVAFVIVAVAMAFGPRTVLTRNSNLQMSMKKNIAAAAIIISTSFSGAAFAAEGAAPKQSFFGAASSSSPYSYNENREDPRFSPYSPYGDGSKSVYNLQTEKKQEIDFWTNQFNTCIKRVDNVPGFVAKKVWVSVRSELTSQSYNMREAMLRLASNSNKPKEATAAAKAYFVDLNDMYEQSVKKDGAQILAAYENSKKDLASFKSLIQ